jgi:SAM-dependent methyltransferase
MSANSPADLQRIYAARFQKRLNYRRAVWRVLIEHVFQSHFTPEARVLDLGCGYGEFINQARCRDRYAMDLNPETETYLDQAVTFLRQDCSEPWNLPDGSLDVVFTSNFFEHLPNKVALGRTLDQARRCLALGGRLIAMGPNIRYLAGSYWDFWDHHLPLTHLSLREALETRGFVIRQCVGRFLPYTMVGGPDYPLFLLRWYLRIPALWRLAGKQFLVVAERHDQAENR